MRSGIFSLLVHALYRAFLIVALGSNAAVADGMSETKPAQRANKASKQSADQSKAFMANSPDVTGDWRVTDVLLKRGLSNAQLSNHRTSSMLLARYYRLQPDAVTVMNERSACALNTQSTRSTTELRALFSGEPATPRVLGIKQKLLGKAADYALPATMQTVSSRKTPTVMIYTYRCSGEQTAINDMGDWFAMAGEQLLLPYTQDARLILSRAPREPSELQSAFCNAPANSVDRIICADSQRFALHRYVESTAPCALAAPAQNERDAIASEHAAKLKKRDECGDNASCVWDALFEHAQWVAQSIPASNHCRAGALQPFTRWHGDCSNHTSTFSQKPQFIGAKALNYYLLRNN
jgi:hypothetical protein